VGTVTAVAGIWPVCQKCHPDVLLLGTSIAETSLTAVLAQLQQNIPELRVLVLLSEAENICLQQLAENGAAGGIFRSELPAFFPIAVQAIMQGESWFSPRLVKRLLHSKLPALTSDETALLRLMVTGQTGKAISKTMAISQRTLRRRLKQICEKLGVTTRIEAAYLAGRYRLLEE